MPAAQAHQLMHVQRCQAGDQVALFNNRDGEWLAELAFAKRSVAALVQTQLRLPKAGPDIWLLFAPIKPARLAIMIEKATELGVAELHPVLTERTQIRSINPEKLFETAREAAEQCERLDVPAVATAKSLAAVLQDWPAGRRLYVGAEAGLATPAAQAFAGHQGPAALLVGPEGGFSSAELTLLRDYDFVVPIGLGPRILRAETAAMAALALWQAGCGDGNSLPRAPL